VPFTFSLAEYADVVYVYCFCDGNALSVAVEKQRLFTNHNIPTRRASTPLRDTGTLPAVRVTAKLEVYQSVNEEKSILRMAERSPRASKRNVPKTRVWRTLHAEGMYPYNVGVQYLESGDLAQRLEFCNWLTGNRRCVVTSCLQT
jgi:hypothetical protein